MVANSVVLPAPFGPISAVMRPAVAVNDALLTARSPPNRIETDSTASSGSGTTALRSDACIAAAAEQARDAARREGDHEHEKAAVDDEIEAGRIAGDELRRLTKRLHHERAEQRPIHSAYAADDRREQRLNRDPRAVGDAGVDEQVVLRIETATRRRDGGGKCHGGGLGRRHVDAEGA